MGLAGRHLLPHLLNHLLDVAGVAEDVLQPLGDIGIVADVALHDVHGVVENVINRQGHGAVDRFDTFGGGRGLFGDEQFQRIQSDGHVAA